MEFKRENYINLLVSHKHNGQVKILTGLKGVGKRFLLNQLFKTHLLQLGIHCEHILFVDLEDPVKDKLKDALSLYNFIKDTFKLNTNTQDHYYLFITEITKLKNFESVLNGLMHFSNLDIYVTSSVSCGITTEVDTQFRGRGDEIKVFPLTLKELIDNATGKEFKQLLKDYLHFGGLPKVYSLKTTFEKQQYLKSLVFEHLQKEISKLISVKANNAFKVKPLETTKTIANTPTITASLFKDILNVLANTLGSLTNRGKLCKLVGNMPYDSSYLKLNSKSVEVLIDLLKELYIIDTPKLYDIKLKSYKTAFKPYFTDFGILNAIVDFKADFETNALSLCDYGSDDDKISYHQRLLENLIFNELLARNFLVEVGEIATYQKALQKWRKQKLEISFVVHKFSRRYYLKVASRNSVGEYYKDEKSCLCAIRDFFKKIIITSDTMLPYQDEEGLIFMGLEDFILDKNSLNIF
ncbi:MAG: AAA family ATPase [Succinivibrio sp.]|nr:AAA family ATPase [Succinivibrio sp.]